MLIESEIIDLSCPSMFSFHGETNNYFFFLMKYHRMALALLKYVYLILSKNNQQSPHQQY